MCTFAIATFPRGSVVVFEESSAVAALSREESPMTEEHACVDKPPEYTIYRTSGPIVVDGHLDESAWQRAPKTRRFVHITSGEPGWFNTQAMMLWDDENLYAACVVEETDVFATEGRRHTPVFIHDPDVELFIDPDGDQHNYYEFQVNPINTINEVFWVNTPGPTEGDYGWDLLGIQTAVQVQGSLNCYEVKDVGWTVELALPFRSMERLCPDRQRSPLPPRSGDTWRLNWTRVQKTRHMPPIVRGRRWFPTEPEAFAANGGLVIGESQQSTDWVWSVAPRYSAHIPETWGYVHFSDRVVGDQ
jgi:hypothetical protein